jgi:hypothetical protein
MKVKSQQGFVKGKFTQTLKCPYCSWETVAPFYCQIHFWPKHQWMQRQEKGMHTWLS